MTLFREGGGGGHCGPAPSTSSVKRPWLPPVHVAQKWIQCCTFIRFMYILKCLNFFFFFTLRQSDVYLLLVFVFFLMGCLVFFLLCFLLRILSPGPTRTNILANREMEHVQVQGGLEGDDADRRGRSPEVTVSLLPSSRAVLLPLRPRLSSTLELR